MKNKRSSASGLLAVLIKKQLCIALVVFMTGALAMISLLLAPGQ